MTYHWDRTTAGRVTVDMKLEVEIPDKYAEKLADIEAVEPTIRDQIEVEILPDALRLINDVHRQLQTNQQLHADEESDTGN